MHSCSKYQSLFIRHKSNLLKIHYINIKLLVIYYLLRSILLENRNELNIAAVECKSEKHINIFIALHEDVHL